MRGEQAAEVAPYAADALSPSERAHMGAQYEAWLQAGFAQAAYKARDIMQYGAVQPETRRRVHNEHKGLAIEKLGEPFITRFHYRLDRGHLVAEDGERFIDIFTRGYEQAIADEQNDSRLSFRTKRHQADVSHAQYLQALASDPAMPEGTTVIIDSPSPDSGELGVPGELLEGYNYRPAEQMAMKWIATKTTTGITLQTVNFFHADPQTLAEATSVVSGRPVEISDREAMPWQRTIFAPEPGADIAEQLRIAFDNIKLRDTGRITIHGLEAHEQAGQNIADLVETAAFTQALAATDYIGDQIAASLISQQCEVDYEYLHKILAMKKADGSYELAGDDRRAVMRAINSTCYPQDTLYTVLRIARQAADASLWSHLRGLVDGETTWLDSDVRSVAHQGISSVESHRQQGVQEFGCQGEGSTAKRQTSIFDMSADQLISAFLRQTFVTNCPLCDEKSVVATKENGTITCGECGGSVEVCTGEVLKKARKKQKTTKAAGWLGMHSPDLIDWFLQQWQTQKQRKQRRVAESMRP